MRLKCINANWKEGLKDPDLTKGSFYDSIDDNLMVLNHEPMVTVFGDNREEVARPKWIFQTMPEMQRLLKKQENVARKVDKHV